MRIRPDGERVYLVYDARAASGDTEEATVMECLNAKEPKAAKREALRNWRGTAFVVYGATFRNNVAIEDDAPLMKHYVLNWPNVKESSREQRSVPN